MRSILRSLLIGLLLLIISIGAKYAFAQAIDSSTIYLPVIRKIIPVQITYAELLPTKDGPEYLVGEINNISASTLYDVSVTATFYLNEEIFDRITVSTELPATFPGGANLFASPFHESDLYAAECLSNDCRIVARPNSWRYEHDPEYAPIAIISKNFYYGHWGGSIYGEVRNDNSMTITDIRVISDGNGDFIAEGGLEQTTLAPGETTSYGIFLSERSKTDPDTFVVLAQGAVVK